VDEVGTPFCATSDGETLEQGLVTVRVFDSMEQVQLSVDEVTLHLQVAVAAWKRTEPQGA
jgi:glycyl-tRNA synthetase (class II)